MRGSAGRHHLHLNLLTSATLHTTTCLSLSRCHILIIVDPHDGARSAWLYSICTYSMLMHTHFTHYTRTHTRASNVRKFDMHTETHSHTPSHFARPVHYYCAYINIVSPMCVCIYVCIVYYYCIIVVVYNAQRAQTPSFGRMNGRVRARQCAITRVLAAGGV